jgi:predicted nucleotidyltransferase component of viral defense system
MIEKEYLERQKKYIRWKSNYMVEQDMIISRVLESLYSNDLIRDTLVFKGGTALNKLFFSPAARYSEDIDLVRIKGDKIGPISKAISSSLLWLVEEAGFGPPTHSLGKYGLKFFYKYQNVEGYISKLKIEVNTREPFHITPIKQVAFSFESDWWSGSTHITTYCIEEIMATKIRAVYQRRKGRDLFDAWYVFSKGLADIEKVVPMFHAYNKYNGTKITRNMFIQNMNEKKNNADFRQDITALLPLDTEYDFDTAFDFFLHEIIPHI